ncbi:MAG: aminoglycoside 3'-phosphotransferase [Clostridia bacterium]|nr:aminoglycoside 3'-phosphotransferase [Clostridia bacterium]
MKKNEISCIPIALPNEMARICRGARIYDSSCSAEARVYYIDRDGGYYLKSAKAGTLKREALMTEYFYKKGLGAEMLSYLSAEGDLLLTRAVAGEDCTEAKYLDEPGRLCDLLAERLRALHETEASDCPIMRIEEYLARAKANYFSDNYNKEHFPDSFGYRSGEEAYKVLCEGRSLLKNEVLLHGDYCLPNIMLDGWKFSGFIDLDHAGLGDRHIDLFWGRWSMGFNLMIHGKMTEGEAKRYEERFLDAYGRDKIDNYSLSIIAAAEVLL